jgi:carbamoyltransferase
VTQDVVEHVVQRIVAGQVAGCFQGRSELGPRALGQRSILCDPRPADMKDKLNQRVKFREGFRPFAPIVLEEDVHEWFDIGDATPTSPFMLRVWKFRAEQAARVPAVVHVDGTGRVQTINARDNPFLHRLLSRFKALTGVPILLNTSFNVAGEPIVETPEDALWCMLGTGIDFCVLDERVVERRPGFRSLLELRPTVIATGLTIDASIVDGKIPANWADDFRMRMSTPLAVPYSALARMEALRAKWNLRWLKAAVNTPWGPVVQVLETGVRRVLAEMDGQRTGFEVLARLKAAGMNIDEWSLHRQLIALRAASVVSLV